MPSSHMRTAIMQNGEAKIIYATLLQNLCCKHDLAIIFMKHLEWNESKTINGVKVSLHPAGHIIGSSQIRVEYNNEVWVASGDYKVANDGFSGEFEPVKCNAFITESTFGLPIYCWKDQEVIFEDMRNWILANKALNKTSIIIAYSLGKAQRVLKALEDFDETIYMHGATYNMHQALINANIPFQKLMQNV